MNGLVDWTTRWSASATDGFFMPITLPQGVGPAEVPPGRCGGRNLRGVFLFVFLAQFLLPSLVSSSPRTGTASWYSRASCAREGTSGFMANGKPLQDHALTVASWDYPFGTHLTICLPSQPMRCVVAVVSDRGPNRKLHRLGRILDLTPAAFAQLAPLSTGVIPIAIIDVELP